MYITVSVKINKTTLNLLMFIKKWNKKDLKYGTKTKY